MLFYGYKLKGKTIKEITNEINPVKEKIQKIADENYHELIGKEIAFLGDCLCLNIFERNLEEDYIKTGLDNVNYWIHIYNIRHLFGRYNYTLYAHLFDYKNHTYLRVDFKNMIFKDAFDGMEEISISKRDYEFTDKYPSDFWHYATDFIQNQEPISINLSPKLKFKANKLTFPTVATRVNQWSRHQELNRLIDSLRFNQDPLPSVRLMPALDYAYETYLDKKGIDAETGVLLSEEFSLKEILLDFNLEENLNTLKPYKEEKNENSETDN